MTDQSPIDQTPEGLDRRTMLKRSAIVGGALVWTTPVVQSLAGPAFAQETSPVTPSCISGSLNDRYFFKVDSDGSLAVLARRSAPDGYTGNESTTLPAGVSGSFSGTTGHDHPACGLHARRHRHQGGVGGNSPTSTVDANGCIKDEVH